LLKPGQVSPPELVGTCTDREAGELSPALLWAVTVNDVLAVMFALLVFVTVVALVRPVPPQAKLEGLFVQFAVKVTEPPPEGSEVGLASSVQLGTPEVGGGDVVWQLNVCVVPFQFQAPLQGMSMVIACTGMAAVPRSATALAEAGMTLRKARNNPLEFIRAP
jgi:hypothetical protein